ncbi:tyrosine-type recombinase/integrase [Micromonospora avicenniae]|uniref:tyrosine-type recombinase/integrase n=1 Tax=Micromonospora avicenniae TaxID=1198245 RepID=UPI00097114F3|nr:tyrosine-type recombinase/integrase [Micromonospora avicenniae]
MRRRRCGCRGWICCAAGDRGGGVRGGRRGIGGGHAEEPPAAVGADSAVPRRRAGRACRRKRREDLVFTAPNGGPLRNTNFRSRVFAPAAASVGLAGLTPHDLRHTAASLAVTAGANVKAVQRILGTPRRR